MNSLYHENFKSNRFDYSKLLGSLSFRVFLSFVALSLLVLYVIRISTVSVKGYNISALQKQLYDLQDENQKLEFQIAQNASMQNIQERLKSIQFVPADKAEFVTLKPSIIAKR